MQTVYILAILVAPALGYEAYALATEGVWTWSRATYWLGQHWNVFAQYALGLLPGHFYIQPPSQYTLAGQVGEWTEVAVVLWLGWGIFAASLRYPEWLPLPWYASLGVLVTSMLIGGFCWTLGA
jgi:hypothetical protein